MKNLRFCILVLLAIVIVLVIYPNTTCKECRILKPKITELEAIQIETLHELLRVTKIVNWHVRYTLKYHPIDPNYVN